MTIKSYLAITFSVLVLLASAGCTAPSATQQTATPLPAAAEPNPAPFPEDNDFAVLDLDGKTVHLSDYAGNVIVVNFWAIWCAPCRMEMPELEAVYQQYRDQGVVVLAVNVSEGAADISRYAQSSGLTFPMVRDATLAAARAYRVSSLPTTLFLDQQGQVHSWSDSDGRQLDRGVGARDRAFFSEHIESLLQ